MEEPQLLHSVTESVATVVIRHPAKRNAMTAAMWATLPPLLGALADDPAVRALVLTGDGGTFCAGADISTLQGSPLEAQRLAVAAEEALAAFPSRPWPPCAATVWEAGRSSRPPATCGSPRKARGSG